MQGKNAEENTNGRKRKDVAGTGKKIAGENNNNNNNNNIYLLQLVCYPVAVVILHVNKT